MSPQDYFRRIRARTRALFDVLDPAAYYTRPIALRNPVVFYEGHLPAFAVNTLIKKTLGRPGIDPHLETIFARGIDPEEEATAMARGNPSWPPRDEVLAYAREADLVIESALAGLGGARVEAVSTILEHEEMHQETLAYIWHEVPYALKQKPESYWTLPPSLAPLSLAAAAGPKATQRARVQVPAGTATLGTPADQFGWDNELPEHQVAVAAFTIDVHNVTNGEYLDYVQQTGAALPHFWQQIGRAHI